MIPFSFTFGITVQTTIRRAKFGDDGVKLVQAIRELNDAEKYEDLNQTIITAIRRGDSGPWTRYDPTQDPYVVLYAAKIN